MRAQIINGTTVYSPLLAGSQNYTSTAGETLSFAINGTGQYVTLANTAVAAADPDGLTHSPFDSPREESTRFACSEFKQNPFKPQGFCNNCFKLHY